MDEDHVESMTGLNAPIPLFATQSDAQARALQDESSIHVAAEEDEQFSLMMEQIPALEEQGNYEEMLHMAKQASRLYPASALALAYQARALQKLQRISEATIANDQALLLDSGLPLAWLNRSGLQILQERFQDALRSAERAVALAPEDARAWANKGMALLNLEYLSEALAAFDTSLTHDPDFLFALQMKGETLRRLRRMKELIPIARHALAIAPDDPHALTLAIQAFSAVEDYAALPPLTEKLAQLMPDSQFAWDSHMRALRSTGRFAEARQAIERVLEFEPENVYYLTIKADTLYRLEDYRQAAATAQLALRLDSSYAPARRIHEKAVRLMYQRKEKRSRPSPGGL